MHLLCVHDILVKTDSFFSNAAFRIFTNLPDFYIFVGGVFSVQVRYWICSITEIHHSIPFVVEMVFVAIPESISGVKASLGWNIGPLIETKMPLSYQVSSVAWRENKGTII